MSKRQKTDSDKIETIKKALGTEDDENLSVPWFKTMQSYLSEIFDLNQSLKSCGDPLEILPSEELLNDLVKQFGNVAVLEDISAKNEVLSWLVESCLDLLVEIFEVHDNFDIKLQVLNVLSDICDEDEEAGESKEEEEYKVLSDRIRLKLVSNKLPSLIIKHILQYQNTTEKLAKSDVTDFEAKAVSLISALLPESLERNSVAGEISTLYLQDSALVSYITAKIFIERKDSLSKITESTQYSSEIAAKLASNLGSVDLLVEKFAVPSIIEILLVPVYKTRKPSLKPSDPVQLEYCENMFNFLVELVYKSAACKNDFVEAEGFDLLNMVFKNYTSKENYLHEDQFDYAKWEKNNKWVYLRMFRFLRNLYDPFKEENEDSAISCCVASVEAGLLKYIFKPLSLLNSKLILTVLFPFSKTPSEKTVLFLQYFLDIIESLLQELEMDSEPRARVLNKVIAGCGRLLEIRGYLEKVDAPEAEEIVSKCNIIIVWLLSESDSVKSKVNEQLKRHNVEVKSLTEQVQKLENESQLNAGENGTKNEVINDLIDAIN